MHRDAVIDSPVSNNGRGLKRDERDGLAAGACDSPVSNNGRGLKLIGERAFTYDTQGIRPLAITGVD